jgi:broad specificity phosphatase PhoE
MRQLIFVRHGETRKNLSKFLHGSNDPESLNDTGRVQMAKTAIRLKEYLPFKLYSSVKRRAVESAKIISDKLGTSINFIEGMEERNWGIYSGKPWEEVKKVLDPMSLDERYDFIPTNGESWRQFEARLIYALNIVISAGNENIVIITHGGSIRALIPYLLDVPKDESFKYDPDNASLTVFEITKNGFRLLVVDDTVHLL